MRTKMHISTGKVDGLHIEIIGIYRFIEQLFTDSSVANIIDRLLRRLVIGSLRFGLLLTD